MDRRTFLTSTTFAAASAALARAQSPNPAPPGIIDTNVYLGDWVVRSSWATTAEKLVTRLRQHGVTSAWTGSFEGVLHTDIAGVNARLAETCARQGGGILRAFGTVNPTLPDWEDDLRRCHEVHRMPGVRLFPNYHGYALDDPRFAKLIELSARRGLLVQITLMIEDDRSQNPALTAAPVQAAPLADIMKQHPTARVMLLNSGPRVLTGNPALLQRLAPTGILFEIATLEGVGGIEALLQRAPSIRLAFGSHVPYFYLEAALLKLQESALTPEQLASVCSGNARAALSA